MVETIMSPKIYIDPEKIAAFCRKWKVTEFSLFGSVLREDFRADSDVDVLVSFEQGAGWSLFDIVEMQDELETIMGRDVDLVEKGAVRNPFRWHSIMTNREVLYAA
jgi:predicted nucleotidyltransferase